MDSSGNVYAAGDSLNQNYFIAKFNGNSWTTLPSPAPLGQLQVIALATDASGNLYQATGNGDIFKWNGVVWTQILISNNSGIVYNMTCDVTGKLYASGSYQNANGNSWVVNVWNGSAWTQLTPNPAQNIRVGAMIFDEQNNLYAAGHFANNHIGVARWNATSWIELGTGIVTINSYDDVTTLAIDGQHNIYAAGSIQNSSGRRIVAKWNGTIWSELGTGVNGLNSLNNVWAITADYAGNICATVDNYSDADTAVAFWRSSYIAKWNGANWGDELGATNKALNSYGGYTGIVIDPANNLYVPATLAIPETLVQDSVKSTVAKWNGTTWSLATSPVNFHDSSLISYIKRDANGNLYTIVSPSPWSNIPGRNYVTKWNGSSWAELGTGTSALSANGNINTIIIDLQNNVYVAGYFTNSNSKTYVAKWNGNTWTELGSGANALNGNNIINDLAIDNSGNIYATGYFTNTSGIPYVAKWNGTGWSDLGLISPSSPTGTSIRKLATDNIGNLYATRRFCKCFQQTLCCEVERYKLV